jgi:hypothetical protein
MSHKTEVKTKLDNLNYIKKALDDMNIKYNIAEEGKTLQTRGQYNVKENVEILITEVNGKRTDAIGFQKQEDGTYSCTGDFWGLPITKEELRNRTTTGAKKLEANDLLMQQGYTLDDTVENANELELTFTRWV